MPVLNGAPYYLSYSYQTTENDDGRVLPNSTSLSNIQWVTIPWNNQTSVPVDPAAPAPVLNGWTLLTGPCVFQITASVGIDDETREAQAHICAYEVHGDTGEEVLLRRNAWEWMVGTKEGHTVHIDGTWCGNLSAGRKLRIAVDFWHGDYSANIIRANVAGLYWRY